MVANIFGERFYGNRVAAWHGIGRTFEDLPSASEAIEKAGLVYAVNKYPLIANTPLGQITSDQQVLIREATPDDPKPRMLGMVGPEYQIIQNKELGQILDPISKEWPVETIGALGRGETVFLTFRAGESSIGPRGKQEDMVDYFLLTDSKDGRRALRVAFTPIRVVCQNTLSLGLSAASVTGTIPHVGNMQAEVGWHLELMVGMKRARAAAVEVLNKMAVAKVVKDQVTDIIDQVYTMPELPQRLRFAAGLTANDMGTDVHKQMLESLKDVQEKYDYMRDRVVDLRGGAMEVYEHFNDTSKLGGTLWAVYNSIVEVEDFRKGRKGADQDAVFGARAATKRRAFDLTAALLN